MPRYLVWLVVGAFAIGTEGFMIAGILPLIAADLRVSTALAGQLVTAFALAYAIGSPSLTVATGRFDRKKVLLWSILSFGIANVLAAIAPSYGWLVASRILLGLAAGTFFPTASGYAAMAVAPALRGRALALIYSGLTIATIVGVPLGTAVAARLGWPATFIGVAVLSAIALVGIAAGLPRVPSPPVASLADRLNVAARSDMLSVLVLTVIGFAGYQAVYPYFAPLLTRMAGFEGDGIAVMLLVYGIAGAAGNFLGGYGADKWNVRRYLLIVLAVLVADYCAFAFIAERELPIGLARPAAAAFVFIWGLAGWMFPATQQYRLVRLAGPLAPIALSLNSSAIYLGTSIGAVLGSLVLASRPVASLGWAAAACYVFAFLWLALSREKTADAVAASRAAE
jgi:predicted MFS family arabinose efflux permease